MGLVLYADNQFFCFHPAFPSPLLGPCSPAAATTNNARFHLIYSLLLFYSLHQHNFPFFSKFEKKFYQTANKNTNLRSRSPSSSRSPMSGLKNSPFGKRLRASHQDTEDEAPRRNRPRINPIFGISAPSTSTTGTPSLDSSRPTTSESSSAGPESPLEQPQQPQQPRIARDYGDRFVPSRDAGDMRTSYHLMDEGGGPSTPSKNRIIPSESDALKGALF